MAEYTLSCERVIAGLRSGLSPMGWQWKPLDLGVAPVKGALTGVFVGGFVTLCAALLLIAPAAIGAGLASSVGSDALVLGLPALTVVCVAVTTVLVQQRRRRQQHALAERARPVVTLLERTVEVLALERNARLIVDDDVLHVAVWSTGGLWFAITVSDVDRPRLELSLPGDVDAMRARRWPGAAAIEAGVDAEHSQVTLALDALTGERLHTLGREVVAILQRAEAASGDPADTASPRHVFDSGVRFVPRTAVLTEDPSPSGGRVVARHPTREVTRLRALARSWALGAKLCARGAAAQLGLALLLIALAIPLATTPRGDWLIALTPAVLLCWGVLCWTLMFDLHLKAPTAPAIVPEPPLELLVDDGPRRLRQGHCEVVLETPFEVVLTRAPDTEHALGIEIRQLGDGPSTARAACIRCTVAAGLDPEVDRDGLPQWHASSPPVPAYDLSQWLWPTLAFYSAVHNRPLPLSVIDADGT